MLLNFLRRARAALAGAAHALARWYDGSALGRGLAAVGKTFAAAAANSKLGLILSWDRDDDWRRSAVFSRLDAAWQRLVARTTGWLAPLLAGSALLSWWTRAALWCRTALVVRDSLACRLLRWYYGDAECTAVSPHSPDAPVSQGVAALQGLTLLALHALVWTVPWIAWSRILALLLAVTALMFVRWLAGERLRGAGLFAPVLAYVLFTAVASAVSITVFGSLRDLALLLGGVGVLFAIVNVRDRRDWFSLLSSVVAVAALVSLYGLYQYVRGAAVASRAWFDVKTNPELTSRVFSTFGNPNTLAMYLELTLPLAIGLTVSERAPLKRALYAAMSLVMLGALVLTMSRGGWLALAFGALVFLALLDARALWLVPLAAAVAYVFLPPVFRTRLATIGSLQDASNAYRVNIWIAALHMIKDFWPTGVGFGYRAFMPIYNYYRLRGQPAYHAHNFYLEQLAELGIIGFALFVWLMARLAAAGLRALVAREDARQRAVVAGALAAFAGIMLHGLFEDIFYLPTVIATFWITMGLMAAARQPASDPTAH